MVMFGLFLVKFLQVVGIFILTVGCQLVSKLSLLSGLEGEGERKKGDKLLSRIPHLVT